MKNYLVAFVVCSLFFAGCEKEKSPESSETVVQEMKGIDENGLINLEFLEPIHFPEKVPGHLATTIEGDELIFTYEKPMDLPNLKVGDTISGSKDHGFFGRVKTNTAVGNELRVRLEFVRFVDLIKKGNISKRVPLGENEYDPNWFDAQVAQTKKKHKEGSLKIIEGGNEQWEGDQMWWDPNSLRCIPISIPGDFTITLGSIEIEYQITIDVCATAYWDSDYDFTWYGKMVKGAFWATSVTNVRVDGTIKILVLEEKGKLFEKKLFDSRRIFGSWIAPAPVFLEVLFGLDLKGKIEIPALGDFPFTYVFSKADAIGLQVSDGMQTKIQKNASKSYYSLQLPSMDFVKDPLSVKLGIKPSIKLQLNAGYDFVSLAKAGLEISTELYGKILFYYFTCLDFIAGLDLTAKFYLDILGFFGEGNDAEWEIKLLEWVFFEKRYCPCETSADCRGPWACIDETCQDCQFSNECKPGLICQAAECVPCVGDHQCEYGDLCVDGLCLAPSCGDGVVSSGEQCEENNLLGQTCEALGYYGGQLECENCAYDESGCDLFGRCGDNVRQEEYGEACDGADLGGQTCESRGFGSGILACTPGCENFDTSGCSHSPTCGNGSLEPGSGELCDGADLGGKTCETLPNGFYGGALLCTADCASYDTSQCERCGDGILQDPHEQCDGGELGGATCESLDMGAGALACAADCRFETTGCTQPPVCGDGLRNAFLEVCDGSSFAPGENCQKYGFYEGDLTCDGCTAIDTSACTGQCGDGLVQDAFGEQCDGDISGTTCDDWGSTGPGVPQCVQCKVRGCPRYTALSTGDNHACAITPTRSAVCWGYNRYGQLGDGLTHEMCDYYDCSATPVVVSGLADVISIAAGLDFSCAVTGDGALWCWGQNTYGKLGIGNTTDQPTPVRVLGPGGTGVFENALMVTAGEQHACAMRSDGTVWCWGYNNYGQLGDSTSTTSYFPVQAGTLNQAEQIAAGKEHTCALLNTGAVWCWGRNESGQLGNGGTSTLTSPQQVRGPGGVGSLGNIIQINLGTSITCAVKDDQTAWCWGLNTYGQLGLGHTSNTYYPTQVTQPGGGGGMTGVTHISAGRITCALRSDDSLYCWGQGGTTSPSYPTLLSPYCTSTACPFPLLIEKFSGVITTIDNSRNDYSCVLQAEGSAWCWGRNTYGQLGNGVLAQRNTPAQVVNLANVRSISTGTSHSCAVGLDDRVWCWGYNSAGQLGDGTKNYTSEPISVVGSDGSGYLENVFSVCATNSSSCALKQDGTVWCWGANTSGQLGNGTTIESLVPAQVVGIDGIGMLEGVRNLSCREDHFCVSFEDNTTACWGANGCYTLGISGGALFPVRPLTINNGNILTDISTIVTGGQQTFVLKTDGSFWLWGGINGCSWPNCKIEWNTIKQLTQAIGVQRITAGSRHECVVTNLGEIFCLSHSGTCSGTWQNYGVLGNGTTTGDQTYSQVIGENGIGMFTSGLKVAAGNLHTCAVKTDATVRCWGRNNLGQLGDGLYHYQCNTSPMVDCVSYPVPVEDLTNVTDIAAGTDHTCAVKADGTVWCWGNNWYNQLGDGVGAFKLDPTRVVETW